MLTELYGWLMDGRPVEFESPKYRHCRMTVSECQSVSEVGRVQSTISRFTDHANNHHTDGWRTGTCSSPLPTHRVSPRPSQIHLPIIITCTHHRAVGLSATVHVWRNGIRLLTTVNNDAVTSLTRATLRHQTGSSTNQLKQLQAFCCLPLQLIPHSRI